MGVRGDAWDRRAFGIVAGLVFGCVVVLLVLSPSGDLDAVLAAQRERAGDASGATAQMGTAAIGSAPQPARAFAAPEPKRQPVRAEVFEVVHEGLRIDGLVADLLDDGIRGNAIVAMWKLLEMPPGKLPRLEAALTSFDVQQRHFAAAVLRRRHERDGGVPTRELLQVCVDALHSGLHLQSAATIAQGPATSSTRFLRDHTVAAREMLLLAIDSVDPQQRLLSAFLLARARIPDRASRVAYLLVQHLGDNHIGGDALLATHGLYRLGDDAVPVMSEARRYADKQGRELIDLIILDLQHPPRSRKDLRARRRLHDISDLYHDPAIEYDLYRSPLPGVPR